MLSSSSGSVLKTLDPRDRAPCRMPGYEVDVYLELGAMQQAILSGTEMFYDSNDTMTIICIWIGIFRDVYMSVNSNFHSKSLIFRL